MLCSFLIHYLLLSFNSQREKLKGIAFVLIASSNCAYHSVFEYFLSFSFMGPKKKKSFFYIKGLDLLSSSSLQFLL